MDAGSRRLATEDEYLSFEREAESKHEYVNGEIVAMAGGTPKHAALAGNVIRVLGNLAGARGCVVLSSDARIHVPETGLYTYADAAVVCDKLKVHAKDKNTIVNPMMLVEVLSEGTEAYDRGAKFAHYRRIPSLKAYLLVTQDERRLELYQRLDEHRWELTECVGEGALRVSTLDVEIPIDEIYKNLDLLEG